MDVRLLVFARAPVPGVTKTRLIPALGAEGAARLHRALIEHTLAVAAAAGPAELQLWTADDDAAGTLAGMARASGAQVQAQRGGDLGARMAHALDQATADGLPALVIGTDCPWLDTAALRQAAALLATTDAVLGPADDGGYVLCGLRRVAPALFSEVDWGTHRVLDTTRARLRALGWDWRELASRPDVDRPEDLDALAALGGSWAELVQDLRG